MIKNDTIIFVTRDIEHRILNNFPDNSSLTFGNTTVMKKNVGGSSYVPPFFCLNYFL